MRYSFDWDARKDAINRRKHNLSFRQAATVFRDPGQLSIYDDQHSQNEDRWITLGIDSSGILRVVVHTFEKIDQGICNIRIISARKANKAEVLQYEDGDE
ncbi:BrnT family toxin [cf. Phormidesmis sp. LEGE 11477]|uniref:BrnT family toxin n=1 Tax=cf. Phormidesmis sp. LEGE 11477 TaxID=1828680 RepID=UPI0018829571|nr:BrnT family toxin [cf. Phormidesmis sp. LEGE 11477]MBE9063532.1 BrnT family toxin [cf. Phormidesmis sp. LEGE 11477]